MPSLKLLPWLLAALLSVPAQAAWRLDQESSRLSFITSKLANVAEVNRFRSLAGSVADDGQVQLQVRLESVDSGIPLRDERLRKQLFDVEQFAQAHISTQLDIAPLLTLAAGAQLELRLPLTVNLHGRSHDYGSELLVTRLDDRRFQVVTLAPLATRYNSSSTCCSAAAMAANMRGKNCGPSSSNSN